MPGCPIRKPADQFVFADPRGLSQLIASFIASESLGILRVPLLTFFSPRPFCYRGDAFVRHAMSDGIMGPEGPPTPRKRVPATVAFSISSCFLPICQRTSLEAGRQAWDRRPSVASC